MRKWITNKLMLWAAHRIAAQLREHIPEELEDMHLRAKATPGVYDDAGIAILRGVLCPKVRRPEATESLHHMGLAMRDRAAQSDGKLDDALVIVIRGALNC